MRDLVLRDGPIARGNPEPFGSSFRTNFFGQRQQRLRWFGLTWPRILF